jgi:hypothetical protein
MYVLALFLVLFISLLDVSVTDILPLPSSVDTVPDPTRYGIKGDLKSERSSENCSQEDSIPPEEGLVESGSDPRHCWAEIRRG